MSELALKQVTPDIFKIIKPQSTCQIPNIPARSPIYTCQIPNLPARSPIYLPDPLSNCQIPNKLYRPDPQFTAPARSPIYCTCQTPNIPVASRSPIHLPDPQSSCHIPDILYLTDPQYTCQIDPQSACCAIPNPHVVRNLCTVLL